MLSHVDVGREYVLKIFLDQIKQMIIEKGDNSLNAYLSMVEERLVRGKVRSLYGLNKLATFGKEVQFNAWSE